MEGVLKDPHGHGGGAAAPVEALEQAVTEGAGPLPQLAGDVALVVQGLKELQETVHRPLADLPAALHAAHAVTHHGEQAPLGQYLRVGGVEQGEGVLLPLPPADPLEVAHPEDQIPGTLVRRGRLRRLGRRGGAAEEPVKQSHGRPPLAPASR